MTKRANTYETRLTTHPLPNKLCSQQRGSTSSDFLSFCDEGSCDSCGWHFWTTFMFDSLTVGEAGRAAYWNRAQAAAGALPTFIYNAPLYVLGIFCLSVLSPDINSEAKLVQNKIRLLCDLPHVPRHDLAKHATFKRVFVLKIRGYHIFLIPHFLAKFATTTLLWDHQVDQTKSDTNPLQQSAGKGADVKLPCAAAQRNFQPRVEFSFDWKEERTQNLVSCVISLVMIN